MRTKKLFLSTTTQKNDPRLTKVGKIIRNYKIDELPQLFNILKGEMSFVGPRPEVYEHVNNYTDDDKIILSVKPGLTDFSSLYYFQMSDHLKSDDEHSYFINHILKKKNRLRRFYVKKKCLSVDIYIIYQTLIRLFSNVFRKI